MFVRSQVERPVQASRQHHTPAASLPASSCSIASTISRHAASSSLSATSSNHASARLQPSTTPRSSCRRTIIPQSTAAADPSTATDILGGDMEYSRAASGILQYALNFALVSETYEAHSWMIVLGLLKQEDCRAAAILKDLGLTDLYGAWNEVLWALNVSNGLEPRAYFPEVTFASSSLGIITGSQNFAAWGGRSKVQSEDILLALAAGHVLSGLFPDLGLTFEAVRAAAAKHGGKYKLPDDSAEAVAALQDENFL